MHPTTGPFITEVVRHWPPGLNPIAYWNPQSETFVRERFVRYGYRQAKPYNLALPLYTSYERVNAYPASYLAGKERMAPEFDAINSTGYGDYKGQLYDHRTANWNFARARSRFNSKMGESALWSVNFAERKQALAMMASRLQSLVTFTSRLKRFDFIGAGRALAQAADQREFSPLSNRGKRKLKQRSREYRYDAHVRAAVRDKRLRASSKYFANNYLEFHFGWSPLMSDIYSTIDILQQDVSPQSIFASSKMDGSFRTATVTVKSEERCKIIGSYTVSNPNLWLANQLGLVNPALVAFELVPFSFVLDWFVNVSEVLGNMSEHWGVTFVDAIHTHSHKESRLWSDTNATATISGSNESFRVTRALGFPPGPELTVRAPWRLSPRRGAAAASLLVQMLK